MTFMRDPDARRRVWCGEQGLAGTSGVVVEFGADLSAGMMEWGVLVEVDGAFHVVTAFPNDAAWREIGLPRVHDRVVFTEAGGFDPIMSVARAR